MRSQKREGRDILDNWNSMNRYQYNIVDAQFVAKIRKVAEPSNERPYTQGVEVFGFN